MAAWTPSLVAYGVALLNERGGDDSRIPICHRSLSLPGVFTINGTVKTYMDLIDSLRENQNQHLRKTRIFDASID